jgi:transposase
MGHVKGVSRDQGALFPERLDDLIAAESPVRVIDAFIDRLNLQGLGFTRMPAPEPGRPSYDPCDLLKLYVYGYMNRLRSSRDLEAACRRNIEVLWLLQRLRPCFKTIAAFRSANAQALRGVCRSFVLFARRAGLLTGRVVAIDGSKFEADNAMERHCTRAQVQEELDRIDRRISAYLEQLDSADAEDAGEGGGGDGGDPSPGAVERALATLRERRGRLEAVHEDMQATGERARALTDADSRKMRTGRGGWIIGYNVQFAVEAEHGLIVGHEVTTDANDRGQLIPMALGAQAALGGGPVTVVADTGYAQAEAARTCQDNAITAIVPRQTPHSHWPGFARERFVYDAGADTYHCPGGAELHLRQEVRGQRRYMTPACRDCAIKSQCTSGRYRQVTRHRHEAALEAMDERAREDPYWMSLRRSTAEHPFGTFKHAQQARRFLTRGLSRVRAEMALSVSAYNLKRMIRILGVEALLEVIATLPRTARLA